jgi:hypothetical protein
MPGTLEQISGLLYEAGETRYQVFRVVDDWASWYTQWLIVPLTVPAPLRRALAGLAAPPPGPFTLVPLANATGPPRRDRPGHIANGGSVL